MVKTNTNCFFQNSANVRLDLSVPGYISIYNYCRKLSQCRRKTQLWTLKQFAAAAVDKYLIPIFRISNSNFESAFRSLLSSVFLYFYRYNCKISTLPEELQTFVSKHVQYDVRIVFWFT